MTTTRRSARGPRRRTAAVAAVGLLAGLVVVSDSHTTGAATPPAELVSVVTEVAESMAPSISADGGLVGFNLNDFFFEGSVSFAHVRDRSTQITENVAFISTDGNQQINAVLSRDGCHVAYVTGTIVVNSATSAQSVVAVNRCAGTPAAEVFSIQFGPTVGRPLRDTAISAHGRYVAFGNGINVTRLDRDPDGNGVLDDVAPAAINAPVPAAHPSLGDELITSKVAIEEIRTQQVRLWDPTRTPQNPQDPLVLTPVSAADGSATVAGNGQSTTPSMTPDGRFVVFASFATNLAGSSPGSSQIYLRDVAANRTVMVTRNAAGTGGDGNSITPSISADGTQIALASTATNLLAPGGGVWDDPPLASLDLLVVRSTSGLYGGVAFDRVSLKPNGDPVNPQPIGGANRQEQPVISSNGRWVAFASRFNAELQSGGASAPPSDTDENVYVIGRPTAVTVTPLDFGGVQVGSTSGVLSATVTNTGISSFLPASIAAGGDFTVVAGGTCAINTFLSPGQSCTVAVTFKPSAAGPRSGTLTVSETGFAAITASGGLAGSGVALPVITTTSTTTTPPTTTTTLPKTTTTTAALTITPNPGLLGASTIGLASAPTNFVVTSTGTRSAPIAAVSISGANAAEFTIVANSCAGANLPPGAGCDVTVVFTPAAAGARVATLTAGSPAASATAGLQGTGLDQPTLRLLPNVVELGELTIAVGAGFPANLPIQVQWVGDSAVFNGTSDGSGNVSIQIPVRPDEIPGPRTLTAVDQPALFTGVTTPGLVVDPTMHPPTSQNPALPNFPSLIVRG